MNKQQFSRTESVFGEAAMQKLAASRVIVFGIGGVGGYTAEALARSGVGALDIVDNDTVSITDINRQIIALHSTLERYKTDVAAERFADINPDCVVTAHKLFYLPETADAFDFTAYDYVVDAIDTVSGKLTIIEKAQACGVPVISAMGAGNKTDPTAFEVADIFSTSVCPLAKVMRKELKKRGIDHLKVVYSKEEPVISHHENKQGKPVPASTAFVPSVAGLIMASEVIKDLIGYKI